MPSDGELCGIGTEMDLDSSDALAGATNEGEGPPTAAPPDAKNNVKINLRVGMTTSVLWTTAERA